MKTKITSIIIITLLVTTIFLFLTFPEDVMSSVTFSISIWKDNLIPSLFPFFITSELLIHYGFVELVGELLKKTMNQLFHLPGEASFVVIGSLVSGFPSSSKYISELLKNKQITKEEASYLLKFNHFSNPLFVIGTTGTLLLNNRNLGILILIVHIISNFIIAYLFRPKNNPYQNTSSSFMMGLDKMHKKRMRDNSSFSEVLSKSIFKTIQTLLLLLGIITTFIIINTLLKKILHLSPFSSSMISGLLEMTGGIKNVALLSIPLSIKSCIIIFFISFGGFSIHMQVMSILADVKIPYLPYFFSRILHGVIASSILALIFMLTT